MTCICPEDGRMIASDKRVYILLPGYERREGNKLIRDNSKLWIVSKDCPDHGYIVIEDEEAT